MANFDAAKAIFAQADTNRDGGVDANEFRNWVSSGGVSSGGAAGGLNSSSFESSSFQSSSGELDASAGLAFGGGVGLTGAGGASGYEAAYSSQSGFESAGSGLAGGLAVGGADGSYAASSSSEFAQSGGAAFESSSAQQTQYRSAGGLFDDPNPQFIRRAAASGPVTYQQKILVRFLQPPPVPPPGPLIIKEVRPPQPPPPPPLRVRQQAPPLPQLPPLILRERPPVAPASAASQTVIRRLAAIPVPPRSVIIERLPPLPPRPRDIIIERWVPYGAQAKRRTIVQRAAAAQAYQQPRNIIIVYDAVQARVVRQFQRLGVTQENPQAYLARYGASLLDAATLLQQARTAGVVEDISAPAGAAVASSQFGASGFGGSAGYDFSSSSSSENFSSAGGATGLEGLQVVGGANTSAYGLDVSAGAGLGVGGGESYSSQSYSSSSNYGAEGGLAGGAGFDLASASFASADTDASGGLDRAEFQRFVQGGL